MKSIQSKIVLLILTGIIVSIAITGGVGIWNFEQVIDSDTARIMNLTCSEKAQELDNVLGRIERSVEILSVYVIDNLESTERLSQDTAYLEEYTEELGELGLTIANETDGAVGVYVRFNPEITPPTAGFFKVKNSESGCFETVENTDFSKYDPDDVEHVGWYYIPVSEEKPIWMQPYYNQNIDIYMISYVIPIYKDGELVGIVGMDIDFDYITEKVDSIDIYETGYAFLTDENLTIIHSRNDEEGTSVSAFSENLTVGEDAAAIEENLYDYNASGVKKMVAFRTLENGMRLAVTAPAAEIDHTKNRIIVQTIVITIFIVVIFIFVSIKIAKTIIRPLKELNVAAREIARGNLDISLECRSKDEVGALSESLRETANQLKIRIDYINNLAYVDELTGIKNNTAYLQEVSGIKENMQKGGADFSLFIVDVNGLKAVNDTYGHECGNEFIIAASKKIARVFGYENVYRVGGDEFAVIMQNVGYGECSRLRQEFEDSLQDSVGEIKLSAAIGSAVYDKTIDGDYESVFKRADEEMYKRKLEMKARGENSAVGKSE